MRQRARPALGDRAIEHPRQPITRDDELLPERIVAIDQRPLTREHAVDLAQRVGEVRLRVHGGRRVVQCLRLLVERQLRAAEHPHPRAQRFELPPQIIVAEDNQLVAAIHVRQTGNVGDQPLGRRVDLRQRHLPPLRLALPVRRTIKRIHIIGIMLTDGQHELHVTFGNGVHRKRLGRLRGHGDRREKHDDDKSREVGGRHEAL